MTTLSRISSAANIRKLGFCIQRAIITVILFTLKVPKSDFMMLPCGLKFFVEKISGQNMIEYPIYLLIFHDLTRKSHANIMEDTNKKTS